MHFDGQQQSCRLRSRKPPALGPRGSLLTNRMREIFTYGSVGGVGRKPGPYPAVDGGMAVWSQWNARGPPALTFFVRRKHEAAVAHPNL